MPGKRMSPKRLSWNIGPRLKICWDGRKTIPSWALYWSHSKSFQHTVPLQHTPESRPFSNFMGTKNDEVLFQEYCGAFLRFIQSLSFFRCHFGSPFPSFPIHNVACVLALESLHKSCHRTALGVLRVSRWEASLVFLSFRRGRFLHTKRHCALVLDTHLQVRFW